MTWEPEKKETINFAPMTKLLNFLSRSWAWLSWTRLPTSTTRASSWPTGCYSVPSTAFLSSLIRSVSLYLSLFNSVYLPFFISIFSLIHRKWAWEMRVYLELLESMLRSALSYIFGTMLARNKKKSSWKIVWCKDLLNLLQLMEYPVISHDVTKSESLNVPQQIKIAT